MSGDCSRAGSVPCCVVAAAAEAHTSMEAVSKARRHPFGETLDSMSPSCQPFVSENVLPDLHRSDEVVCALGQGPRPGPRVCKTDSRPHLELRQCAVSQMWQASLTVLIDNKYLLQAPCLCSAAIQCCSCMHCGVTTSWWPNERSPLLQCSAVAVVLRTHSRLNSVGGYTPSGCTCCDKEATHSGRGQV